MQYDNVTTNPIWRTDPILKIIFRLYPRAIYSINAEFRGRKQNEFYAGTGHMSNKIANFENSRWRMDVMLKIVLAISQRHVRLTRNLKKVCT